MKYLTLEDIVRIYKKVIIDEQEQIILGVAAGEIDKETFTNWVKTKITEFK